MSPSFAGRRPTGFRRSVTGNNSRAGRRPGHRATPVGDRGSLSILTVVLIPGLLTIIGLAVDGGAKVQATQRANAVADEAARAGGQALDRGEALGGGVTLDVAAAVSAAQAYLAAADVPGSVAVVDGDTLLVTTTVTQDTVLLDLVGISTMTVTGSSTADLVQD